STGPNSSSISVAMPSGGVASAKDQEDDDDEIIRRPDDATRLDPEPPVEEHAGHVPQRPLAKWTERLLEAEASETAVSRGMVKNAPAAGQPAAPKNELQKSTPVGPIPRSTLRKVMPGANANLPAPPSSVRVATKFEVDDTLQSPQGEIVMQTPQVRKPASANLGLPPQQPISQGQLAVETPQPIHPMQQQQQQQQQQQAPYIPPPPPPVETSSSTARILFYGVLVITAVLTYLVVRHIQHGRAPSAPVPTTSAPHAPSAQLAPH
ncbi:MAG: hypothetical protein ABI461_12310, partial [Polyangiaceae bacterium]